MVVLKEYPEALWDNKDCMAMEDVFDNFAVVENYLIQQRGFRLTLFIVLELFLLALPGVAREHTQGVIVESRGEVAWLLARNSGEGF